VRPQGEFIGGGESGGRSDVSDTIRAETPVYGGYVLSRDGKVMFIKGAIPGELVEVYIEDRRRDYSIASVRNVIEPSPSRRQPPCPVFGICGGCQLQYMDYETQVSIKEGILRDTMKRIGDIDIELMPSMADREFRYRHRGQFKVSQRGEIGFYREGTRELVTVSECPLMVDEINETLQRLKGIDLEGVREVHIISGDTVAMLIKGNLSEDVAHEILKAGVSGIAFENGDSMGKDYITLDLNGLKYTVTPWSFFQSHWDLNRRVVKMVLERLTPFEGKRILDLYAGAGNFSLPLSLSAKEVVSVEDNPYAVEDGRRNAMVNGIKNCRFIRTSIEEYLGGKRHRGPGLFGEVGYDIVILDPPRPGLTSHCIDWLMSHAPERIVYISCNPATLARDVKRMKEKYEIGYICMIDLFPNTYHIEAMVLLELRR